MDSLQGLNVFYYAIQYSGKYTPSGSKIRVEDAFRIASGGGACAGRRAGRKSLNVFE